jgi:tRNA A37 methylthiotransferase MiaB
MPGHCDTETIKSRAQELRDISKVLRKQYLSRFIGKTVDVLWEKDMDDLGRPLGTTRNYINIAASRATAVTVQGAISRWTIKGFVTDERLLAIPSA